MKVTVLPIAHPSWIFRGQWAHAPLQTRYLARAHAILEGTYAPPDITTAPPSANLYPTLGDLHAFLADTSSPYAVDIECAGDYLVIVGIIDSQTEHYICIRFRGSNGDIWEPDSLESRCYFLFDFLADPLREKIFHNGQAFDIPLLEKNGFTVRGYIDDTMLQAHLTYAELPKRLAFLADIYCDIPNWKTLVSPDEEEKEQ